MESQMLTISIPEVPGMESPLRAFGDKRGWKQSTCFDYRHLAGPEVDVNAVAEGNAPYLGYSYHVPGNVLGYFTRSGEPAAIVVDLGEDFKVSEVVDTFFEQIELYQIRHTLARLPDVTRRPVLVLLSPGENGLAVEAAA